MKKIIYLILGLFLGVVSTCLVYYFINNKNLASLPKPQVTGGERGMLGIDKNINEQTIDKYLGRSDSVYRDMRMLSDPGNYEAIGGDSKLSGTIKGFEIVPLPYIVNVEGLPSAVGNTYQGNTLFTQNEDGSYTANYNESLEFLKLYFPQDKYIFLMCGGGGYAGMTKKLLVYLGWDEDKIYDIGGYWYYEGKNKVEIKKEVNGKIIYEFWKLNYHDINFDNFTKK